MRRRYGRCHSCGGRVRGCLSVVDYRWGDKLLAIIPNVPTGVCEGCGERYFSSDVVKAMERLAHSHAKASVTVAVPVRELKVA